MVDANEGVRVPMSFFVSLASTFEKAEGRIPDNNGTSGGVPAAALSWAVQSAGSSHTAAPQEKGEGEKQKPTANARTALKKNSKQAPTERGTGHGPYGGGVAVEEEEAARNEVDLDGAPSLPSSSSLVDADIASEEAAAARTLMGAALRAALHHH